MNSWMTSANYLAQMAHFLAGFAILMTASFVAVVLGHPHAPHVAAALLVVYGLLKEYVYDMRFELPRQTWWDSTEDLLFYLLGGGAGWGSAWVVASFGGGS